MFRALSMSMFGHENEHGKLRAAIARHMEYSIEPMTLSDDTVRAYNIEVSTDKKWIGEDVLFCAADLLLRDIHMYLVADTFSPVIYSPKRGPATGVSRIGFYEPGHYKAVTAMKHPDTTGHCRAVVPDNNITTLSRKALLGVREMSVPSE